MSALLALAALGLLANAYVWGRRPDDLKRLKRRRRALARLGELVDGTR